MPIKNAFGLKPNKRVKEVIGGNDGKPIEVPLGEYNTGPTGDGGSGTV